MVVLWFVIYKLSVNPKNVVPFPLHHYVQPRCGLQSGTVFLSGFVLVSFQRLLLDSKRLRDLWCAREAFFSSFFLTLGWTHRSCMIRFLNPDSNCLCGVFPSAGSLQYGSSDDGTTQPQRRGTTIGNFCNGCISILWIVFSRLSFILNVFSWGKKRKPIESAHKEKHSSILRYLICFLSVCSWPEQHSLFSKG